MRLRINDDVSLPSSAARNWPSSFSLAVQPTSRERVMGTLNEALKQAADPSTPGFTKSTIAKNSVRSFCTGVPVSARVRVISVMV